MTSREQEPGDTARLVARADRHRFRAAMSAPAPARIHLMALFAFNIEIARAPWAAREPMLGQIRLHYWADQIAAAMAGRAVDHHPVLDVLAPLIAEGRLPGAALRRMALARERDLTPEPFSDSDELLGYISDTSGVLLELASQLLSAASPGRTARAIGTASGLAAWLVAVPELTARGRQPLPEPDLGGIADLARRGLALLGDGRLPKPARPALLTATEARPVLALAARDPAAVGDGRLVRSPFRVRWRQLACAMRGRV